MTGDPKVINGLQKALGLETTAALHHKAQGEVLKRHGYKKLAKYFKKESHEQRDHQHRMMKRLAKLDQIPNAFDHDEMEVTPDCIQAIKNALHLERKTSDHYTKAMGDAMDAGDTTSHWWMDRNKRHSERNQARYESWLRHYEDLGPNNFHQEMR